MVNLQPKREKRVAHEPLFTPAQPDKHKKLLSSYIDGIFDAAHGESYAQILRYFFPEFISALLLYSLLSLLDARWIADLKSTSAYATHGATNTLFHFLIKMGEGFSVGTVILAGHFNGLKEFKKVGRSIVDAFWITILVGGVIAAILYFAAEFIFTLWGIPEKMIELGTPVLRYRALSIFFMFIYFALIGFMRGIKNTRVPMIIYIIGGAVFLFFDYALIFGAFGFPALKLKGAALAAVAQYAVMCILAFIYVFFFPENRKYGAHLLNQFPTVRGITHLFQLSWPVMLDKSILAASYIWLAYIINPMGKYVIASYTVIKDLERLAIIPAVAFAQVITFLVSNAYAVKDWKGIKSTIKKTIFLSAIFVFTILVIFSIWSSFIIGIFDPKGKFTAFSSQVFPLLSVLVFFDLLQLILSGALRGAADVKTVMWVRLAVGFGYFVPLSWYISRLPLESTMLKFLLIYGSFYVGNALMSIFYIYRFRTEAWKTKWIRQH